MEFVANESKKVEIETSTGVYQRHAIQTHFVQIGENYIDLIERYVKPLYEEGDLLSISEKVIALCQKRIVYRKDIHPGFEAAVPLRTRHARGSRRGYAAQDAAHHYDLRPAARAAGGLLLGGDKALRQEGRVLQGLRTRGGRHRRSDRLRYFVQRVCGLRYSQSRKPLRRLR